MDQTTKLKPRVINQVKLYIRQVKSAKIPVEQVIVFGSHAKGTAHKWSDIDVCVVSPIFTDNHWDALSKLMHLRNSQTIDIEPHPMSPRDLSNKYDTLATEIRTHGILIQ